MSDRIYLTRTDGESMQLFGNYEFPEKLYKYLKKNGCQIDDEFCFSAFKIDNFHDFFKALEGSCNDRLNQCNKFKKDFFSGSETFKRIVNNNRAFRKRNDTEDIQMYPILQTSIEMLDFYAFLELTVLEFLAPELNMPLNKAKLCISCCFYEKLQFKPTTNITLERY